MNIIMSMGTQREAPHHICISGDILSLTSHTSVCYIAVGYCIPPLANISLYDTHAHTFLNKNLIKHTLWLYAVLYMQLLYITYWMGSHLVEHSSGLGRTPNQRLLQLLPLETDCSYCQEEVGLAHFDLTGKLVWQC